MYGHTPGHHTRCCVCTTTLSPPRAGRKEEAEAQFCEDSSDSKAANSKALRCSVGSQGWQRALRSPPQGCCHHRASEDPFVEPGPAPGTGAPLALIWGEPTQLHDLQEPLHLGPHPPCNPDPEAQTIMSCF